MKYAGNKQKRGFRSLLYWYPRSKRLKCRDSCDLSKTSNAQFFRGSDKTTRPKKKPTWLCLSPRTTGQKRRRYVSLRNLCILYFIFQRRMLPKKDRNRASRTTNFGRTSTDTLYPLFFLLPNPNKQKWHPRTFPQKAFFQKVFFFIIVIFSRPAKTTNTPLSTRLSFVFR